MNNLSKPHCAFLFWMLVFVPAALFSQPSLEAKKGDTLFAKSAYYQAIVHYKIALTTSTDSSIVCHIKKQLAKCYGQLNDLRYAEEVYKDIIKTCKTDLSDLRNFARLLQKAGEYDKAKRIYASCYHADSTDLFSYENMYFCDTIKRVIDHITEVYLDNVYEVNSEFDDVLNEVNNDSLLFISSRKASKSDLKQAYNNQYPYRMYHWHPSYGKRVSTVKRAFGDGFTSSDLEDEDVFFSKTEPHPKKSTLTRTAIYRSQKTEKGYTEALKFGFDDDSSTFGHPNLSPDGTMFFFVSDRLGGFGGMDIYCCRKMGSKWSVPINLGSEINTPDNELFPFYLGQGLLFFSSNGHAGFGGYDLYSTLLKREKWNKPTNLSLPINSKGDDVALRCDKTKKTFYVSSNRPKGKGGFDIYKLQQFKIADLNNAVIKY